jgi:undecaprenyl-diphosphatase
MEAPAKYRPIIVAGFGALTAFLALTLIVVSGVIQTLDLQAALAVNRYYLGSVGDPLMVLLTTYGREVAWGLLVIVMFIFGSKRAKLLAMELVGLFAVGIVIGELGKIIVGRTRPDVASGIVYRIPVSPTDLLAYPSGHALIVSIGAAFCLLRFRKKIFALLLTFEAALVSYSRVYVGVHYTLDVAGGVLLGIATALIGAIFIEKYLSSSLQKLLDPILLVLKEGPLDV